MAVPGIGHLFLRELGKSKELEKVVAQGAPPLGIIAPLVTVDGGALIGHFLALLKLILVLFLGVILPRELMPHVV